MKAKITPRQLKKLIALAEKYDVWNDDLELELAGFEIIPPSEKAENITFRPLGVERININIDHEGRSAS